MKICLIGKYPPVAGGVSAQTYWFVRALGERGIKVHIVTNALLVESPYRQILKLSDSKDKKAYQPKNVFVHNLPQEKILSQIPIPHTDAIATRLANSSVSVIKKHRCDVIHSVYTLPYAFAGYLSKSFTGITQLLETSGSDAKILFNQSGLSTAFFHLFKNADAVITLSALRDELINRGISPRKFYPKPSYRVDPDYFNPDIKPISLGSIGLNKINKNAPLLLVACKTNRAKGIFELVKALSGIKKDFQVVFVTDGIMKKEFMEHLDRYPYVRKKSKVIPFLPPWKMPSLIKRARCVIHLERKFHIKEHFPVLPNESFAIGTCTLLSNELANKPFYKGVLKDGKNTFIVDPLNINKLRKKLDLILTDKRLVYKIGLSGYKLLKDEITDFDNYINGHIKIYEEMLSGKRTNLPTKPLLPKALS